MSAVGRWFMTPHAVRRYQERIARGLTYEQALGRLIRAAERSHHVKTAAGVEHWRCGRPDGCIRFRVAPGAEGRLPQLLTVLPAFDGAR